MSLSETMLGFSPYRRESEGDLEEQVNNLVDRGLKLYLTYLALQKAESALGGVFDDESVPVDIGQGLQAGLLSQLRTIVPDYPIIPKRASTLQRLFG